MTKKHHIYTPTHNTVCTQNQSHNSHWINLVKKKNRFVAVLHLCSLKS